MGTERLDGAYQLARFRCYFNSPLSSRRRRRHSTFQASPFRRRFRRIVCPTTAASELSSQLEALCRRSVNISATRSRRYVKRFQEIVR